jgi:hypothetical protein
VLRDLRVPLAAEFPEIEWFDASAALCDDKQCRAMVDGRLMYRDNNHLSYQGDLFIGKHFAAWRQERAQHRR